MRAHFLVASVFPDLAWFRHLHYAFHRPWCCNCFPTAASKDTHKQRGQLLIVSILVVQKECPHSLKQKFISTPGTLSACPQLPEAFHLSCRSRIVPDSSAPHLWTIRWRRSCHPIQCHPTVARTAHPSIILHTCCCRRRSRGSASHRHRRSGVSKTTEVVE